MTLEYTRTTGSLSNQLTLPTWGTKGTGHASKMHTVNSSSQASHCLVEGTQSQLVPGFQLPVSCACAAEAFLFLFSYSIDEMMKHHSLICSAGKLCVREVCVLLSIYIQRSIFTFVLTKQRKYFKFKNNLNVFKEAIQVRR